MGIPIDNVWHFDPCLCIIRHLNQLYCTKSTQFTTKILAYLTSKIEKKIWGGAAQHPHPTPLGAAPQSLHLRRLNLPFPQFFLSVHAQAVWSVTWMTKGNSMVV